MACSPDVSHEREVCLWHELFSHIDMKQVRKFCLNEMGLSLPETKPSKSFVCKDCLACKSVQKQTLGRTGLQIIILEVLVSNFMGPFSEDLNGARFVITFRNVFTTYLEIVMIQQKIKVPKIFTSLVARWEKETGMKVKTVRSDGGGEYMKHTFKNWLKSQGIFHKVSNPHELDRMVLQNN